MAHNNISKIEIFKKGVQKMFGSNGREILKLEAIKRDQQRKIEKLEDIINRKDLEIDECKIEFCNILQEIIARSNQQRLGNAEAVLRKIHEIAKQNLKIITDDMYINKNELPEPAKFTR